MFGQTRRREYRELRTTSGRTSVRVLGLVYDRRADRPASLIITWTRVTGGGGGQRRLSPPGRCDLKKKKNCFLIYVFPTIVIFLRRRSTALVRDTRRYSRHDVTRAFREKTIMSRRRRRVEVLRARRRTDPRRRRCATDRLARHRVVYCNATTLFVHGVVRGRATRGLAGRRGLHPSCGRTSARSARKKRLGAIIL